MSTQPKPTNPSAVGNPNQINPSPTAQGHPTSVGPTMETRTAEAVKNNELHGVPDMVAPEISHKWTLIEETGATHLFDPSHIIPSEAGLVVIHPNLYPQVLEYSPEFVRRLQKELSDRLLLIASGADERTAIDQVLYQLFEHGHIRYLSSTPSEA